MAESIEKIREAVCKNRGGWSGASDAEIKTIWASLSKETQKQYIESVSTKGKKNVSDKSGTDVRG